MIFFIAENLFVYPKEHVIYGDYAYKEWDEEKIKNLLCFFTPENMRIDVLSKSFPESQGNFLYPLTNHYYVLSWYFHYVFFFSFLHRKCKCFLEVTWSHRFFSFFFLLQIIKMSRCYLKVGYYGQLFINVGAASGLIQNYIFISGFFFLWYKTTLYVQIQDTYFANHNADA